MGHSHAKGNTDGCIGAREDAAAACGALSDHSLRPENSRAADASCWIEKQAFGVGKMMRKQPDGSQPLTKTRLRRGEIVREKSDPTRYAEIIDFLPAVHGDVEDILCDLSAEDDDGGSPPHPPDNPD